MLTLPNMLTLLRLALIPIVLFLCLYGFLKEAFLIAVVMFLTDFLDGKLARFLKQESPLGALLDPVVDKAIVLTFFPYFYFSGLAPLWFVILVITRDIAQLLSIPILKWGMGIDFHVKPSRMAKWATALNFILIGLWIFLLSHPHRLILTATTSILIPLNAGLEVYILATYLPRFFQIATGRHDTFE